MAAPDEFLYNGAAYPVFFGDFPQDEHLFVVNHAVIAEEPFYQGFQVKQCGVLIPKPQFPLNLRDYGGYLRLFRFCRTFDLEGVDMLTYPKATKQLWKEVKACPRVCYTTVFGFEAIGT